MPSKGWFHLAYFAFAPALLQFVSEEGDSPVACPTLLPPAGGWILRRIGSPPPHQFASGGASSILGRRPSFLPLFAAGQSQRSLSSRDGPAGALPLTWSHSRGRESLSHSRDGPAVRAHPPTWSRPFRPFLLLIWQASSRSPTCSIPVPLQLQ